MILLSKGRKYLCEESHRKHATLSYQHLRKAIAPVQSIQEGRTRVITTNDDHFNEVSSRQLPSQSLVISKIQHVINRLSYLSNTAQRRQIRYRMQMTAMQSIRMMTQRKCLCGSPRARHQKFVGDIQRRDRDEWQSGWKAAQTLPSEPQRVERQMERAERLHGLDASFGHRLGRPKRAGDTRGDSADRSVERLLPLVHLVLMWFLLLLLSFLPQRSLSVQYFVKTIVEDASSQLPIDPICQSRP